MLDKQQRDRQKHAHHKVKSAAATTTIAWHSGGVQGSLAVADVIPLPRALASVGTVCIGALEDIVAVEEHLRVEGGTRGHQVPKPLLRDATQPGEVQVT